MGRYRNPVLPGCHPDPSICRVGDDFYLVTSSFEYLPGLPIHTSTNLVDWSPLGHALHRPGQLDLSGLASSRGLYAPTIRHHDGTFFVVCTVVGPDDGSWSGRTGHFVVTARDAAGPWTDPVWIDGVGGFDPSLTFDGDRVWLVGTEPMAEPRWPGHTGVWLVELDPGSLQPLGAPAIIWEGAMLGAVWAEGPHLVPRPGGGWMLVAAEGGTARDHAVCVAYADSLEGPYVGDLANPRLSHRELGSVTPIASVGHADLVDDGAGRTWATVLATRLTDGADGLLGRQTHLVPVGWEDRRPLFAPGLGRVGEVVEAEGVPDQLPAAREFGDGFRKGRFDPAWNGVGRHPSEFAELVELASGEVVLSVSGGAEPASLGAQSFLGRRLPVADADVAVALEVPGPGVRAGLLVRTSELAHLELRLDDTGRVSCVLTAGRVPTVLAEARVAVGPDAIVELGLEIRGLALRASVDGSFFAEAELCALVPNPASGFVGVWVGPVAVGAPEDRVRVREVTISAR
ncbi:family 43 glycosylhydrolase [Herbiconiux sp. KACC 21604]|uniref:glycoside hydrolase family 43 protein n=1 Tax=unclassified Herbiconiux TaxID=2618217 RepID=UPI0014924A30|nr:glycoside hydrolase family 43 protein [Herbiconiux sp. SALV-R1]QJU52638.1 family 43 glycosylhydrolase [Herbiconiux sp. SALV-R1]WPO87531.1 family 43 glycosylhydrolase [Herbiconiux sp. KACC 21604]